MAMPSSVSPTATFAGAALGSSSSDDRAVRKLMEPEAALSVPSTVTVSEASRRMLSHAHAEAAIVDGVTNGVITDLDVVRSLATKGWMAPFLQVKKAITTPPDVVGIDDKTIVVLGTMLRKKLGHVAVVMESNGMGILSIPSCLLDAIRRLGGETMQAKGVSLEELTLGSIVSEGTTASVDEKDTVTSAAAAIVKAKKAVIVLRGGEGVGVVASKELMRRVFVDRLDIAATTVADVMTCDPDIMPWNTTVLAALEEMLEKDCLHVLVGGANASAKMAVVVHVWDIVDAIVGADGSRMEEFIQKMMEADHLEEEETSQENAAISSKAIPWGSVSAMASSWEQRFQRPVYDSEEEEKRGEEEEEDKGGEKEDKEEEKGGDEEDKEEETGGDEKDKEEETGGDEEDKEEETGGEEEEEDKGGEVFADFCPECYQEEEVVASEAALVVQCDRTVREVALDMASKTAESALVTRRGCVVGVVTYRSLTHGVIASGKSLEETTVGDVMTPMPGMAVSTGLDRARESSVGVEGSSGSKAPRSGAKRLFMSVGLAVLAGVGMAIVSRRGRR